METFMSKVEDSSKPWPRLIVTATRQSHKRLIVPRTIRVASATLRYLMTYQQIKVFIMRTRSALRLVGHVRLQSRSTDSRPDT
eukprot:3232071-Rhodomonas_salina.2